MTKLTPINPNTGKPMDPLECTPVGDIPSILQRARSVAREWARLPYAEKRAIFEKIGKDLGESADTIGALIHQEMGKPEGVARKEVLHAAKSFSHHMDVVEKAQQPDRLSFEGGETEVHYVPLGVVALITPWNFPVGVPLSALIPALLGGNTVIYKPSEIVPRTGIATAEVFQKHLPENVLQVVTGADEQGRALAQAEVDLVGFVGSAEVGKKIMKGASDRMCRILLEMGGKDPMVVAKDADLDKAADYAVRGAISNTGQVCCSVERIYVENSIENEFIRKVLERTKKVNIGAEEEGQINIGPMSNETQMKHVLRQVEAAVEQGATLHHGGKRIERDGFWIEPGVLTGVTSSMEIMKDETFGPVVCIQGVDSLDEAMRLANDTRYGLAATIWMGDEEEAKKRALELEAGCVGVNRSFGGASDMPWAGAKESGFGFTNGVAGARHFLQPRSVAVSR